MRKDILIGFIIGLLANVAGCYLYLFFFTEEGFIESIKVAWEQGVLGNVIALGAVLNLIVFFIFLKKKQDYRARGVILATVVAAIGVLLSNYV